MEKASLQLSVSDFIAITNQTLEYAYPSVMIEGEVSSFKINQGKFVFFDLKDAGAELGGKAPVRHRVGPAPAIAAAIERT
ncbi:hypothetical protein B7Z17_03970, partial [Candidatus Saccharibacteria bacterium 32-49-10]